MLSRTARQAYKRQWRALRAGAMAYEVARKAKMPESVLSKIENGHREPSPEQRVALARALNVSVDELPTTRRAA